jgi:N-acetylglucosamine-6-phosphate deacetylase
VIIRHGRIEAIEPQIPAGLLINQPDVVFYSFPGCFLTPGMVDVQFNGAYGCDLNHATLGQVQRLMHELPRHGVTSVLATLITQAPEDRMQACNILEEAIHQYRQPNAQPQTMIRGLHLEGPFLSPKRAGIHPPQYMVQPTPAALQAVLTPNTRMVTLAPELDAGYQTVAWLKQHQIVVSAGHTDANWPQGLEAIQAGVTSVTHLCNAMRSFHHRDPGLLGLALSDSRVTAQIIADGVHIAPEALQVLLRLKSLDDIVVTSDAMPLAGLPHGAKGEFAGQAITVKGRQAVGPDGTLAGSTTLLDQAVRNLVGWGLMSFVQAIQLVTQNPARLALPDAALGVMAPGAQADLVAWRQDNLTVAATWVGGDLVYQSSDFPQQGVPQAEQPARAPQTPVVFPAGSEMHQVHLDPV